MAGFDSTGDMGVVSIGLIASHTEEMGSIGVTAGIVFGLMACIPNPIFALTGLLSGKKPLWPDVLGMILSTFSAACGIWIFTQLVFGYR